MGKCYQCYYSDKVYGNRLVCKGQKYMPYVGANWGCKWFKPKIKYMLVLTEHDIKQLADRWHEGDFCPNCGDDMKEG